MILKAFPSFGKRNKRRDLRAFAQEYEHHFVIVTDGDDNHEDAFDSDPAVQSLFVHPTNPGAVPVSIEWSQDENSEVVWRLKVEWSTAVDGEQIEDPTQPTDPQFPVNRQPEVEWDWSSQRVKAQKGFRISDKEAGTRDPADQVLVASSAGEVFENGLERDKPIKVATIRRAEVVPPIVLNSFHNAINSDPIVVDTIPMGKFTAKLKGIRIGKKEYYQDFLYRNVSYTIEYDPETWFDDILDHGHLAIQEIGEEGSGQYGVGPVAHPKTGQPITRPVLLNGFGEALQIPDGANPAAWLRDNAVFLTYDFHIRQTFQTLNFPVV